MDTVKGVRHTRPVIERLQGKFLIGDGCWEWLGSKNKGYGQINEGGRGKPLGAHRVVYEWLVGPIPDGMQLDHLCRNRACVKPSHLQPVTQAENKRRGEAGQLHKERMAASTHCKHGHEWTPENTYTGKAPSGNPGRRCRKCAARRQREYNARRG